MASSLRQAIYKRRKCLGVVVFFCGITVLSILYMDVGGKGNETHLREEKDYLGNHCNVHVSNISVRSLPADAASISCNRSELSCFQHFISIWPAKKPRAAIYILVRGSGLLMLQKTLQSLHKYFTCTFPYPVILFHEKDFRVHIRHIIQNFREINIYFQEISFAIPVFLTKPVPQTVCEKPIGYRHMCRFQSKLVYEQPIIHELDYYWRLDDDSLLRDYVKYDIFEFMHMHSYEYGYRIVGWDQPRCVRGLWSAAKEFVSSHQEKVNNQSFSQLPENKIFYNNFEVSKVSFWLSGVYKEYIDFIDQTGGIYYHRWGDAPIKTIAIAMFLPESKIYLFNDICYKHQEAVTACNVTSDLFSKA